MLILNVMVRNLRAVIELIEVTIFHTLKKIKNILLAVLPIKLFVLFSKLIVLYRGKKNAVYRFIEAILKEYDYCRRVKKSILIRI